MEIKKINAIKYKSYVDFLREKTCKETNGTEAEFAKFNIFFGENGSGKSSLCEVLKNLFGKSGFEDTYPTYISCTIKHEVAISNTHPTTGEVYSSTNNEIKDHVFQSNSWNETIDPTNILFFDVDYIHNNVHTHGERSDREGRHAQNSGQLIIDIDEKSNILKSEISALAQNCTDFENANKIALEYIPTEVELSLYKTYKDITSVELENTIKEKGSSIVIMDDKIKNLNSLKQKANDIASIQLDNTIFSKLELPTFETINELFVRKINQKTIEEVSEEIKIHFSKHKGFLAKDDNYKKITNTTETHCPLCSQSLDNVANVISYYEATFDVTYEIEKSKHKGDVNNLIVQLKQIETVWKDIPSVIGLMFTYFENLHKTYGIEKIYSFEKKAEIIDKISQTPVPSENIQLIEELQRIGSYESQVVDINILYVAIEEYIKSAKIILSSLQDYQNEANIEINTFKEKYSDVQKIDTEIVEITTLLLNNKKVFDFLNNDQKSKIELSVSTKQQYESLKTQKKTKDNELTSHLQEKIPESVINNMIQILNKFSFSFSLEHIRPNPRANNYTFGFKIKDSDGNYRNLKNGLSEGERQLISLAFFFATSENIVNKENKILVLDDPITSLDSPNLKILADLIVEQLPKYKQLFVFTHHPLFHKYLSKCDISGKKCFGILKNTPEFGGSFLFKENSNFDLDQELSNMSSDIGIRSQNGTLVNEELCLKYGQYLRLAVEKFIKYDILLWDKERAFDQVLGGLSTSKTSLGKLTNEDIDELVNMYKYCNYSNLMHIDKESPSTLGELNSFVVKYLSLIQKYRE